VAGVDADDAQLHGRAGWNPALVQLQAKPILFPWENQQAAAFLQGVQIPRPRQRLQHTSTTVMLA